MEVTSGMKVTGAMDKVFTIPGIIQNFFCRHVYIGVIIRPNANFLRGCVGRPQDEFV